MTEDPNVNRGESWSHLWRGLCVAALLSALMGLPLSAEDWTRFRGANGAGQSAATGLPQEWSESRNLVWKRDLPGEGSSSPVLAGDRIFVTCYAEYGGEAGADPAKMKRQLVCIGAEKGEVLWTAEAVAAPREDPPQGYILEHGYASNSAVTDGDRVYAFFGKSGVAAYDLDGKELWARSVGTESANRQWGSAASLTLFEDLLIVNAAEEGRAVLGLNKLTGEQVWKSEAAALELAYGTPSQLQRADGQTELILAVPGEVWGLNARTGKLAWYAETPLTGNVSPSPLVDGQAIYVFGGFRSSGSLRVRAGGRGDVTQTHIEWTSRSSSYVATPVLVDGRLYWVDDQGIAWCLDAGTGETIYRERVPGLRSGGRPVYASPIAAEGRIYVVTRRDGVLVLPAEREFRVLQQNRFAGDESDFNATPAVHGQRLLLRSNRALYCVGESTK
ncbi:MAG: PQQ-binding-like beta-propeller repeat protein [Planctomycetaceae bacterium]